MTQEMFLAAGINYAAGAKRFGGKSSLYDKYLNKFPQDNNYNDLLLCLGKKDYDEAFQHAHALKGLAGNLSLDQLYTAIVPLVEALRNQRLSELEPLVEPVCASYMQVVNAISSL